MEGALTSRPRSNHAQQYRSEAVLQSSRLLDQNGTRLDLSDRPLVCCSTNNRSEVVVGGTDHALYSIDLRDLRRKPITMYTKVSGHTDWVTTAAHLCNGQVLSGAMDGKLCLWSQADRRNCVTLNRDNTHPVSKVLADSRYNAAVSCGYDGNIELWRFGEADVSMPRNVRPIRGSFGSTAASSSGASSSISPATVLTGHTQPVLEASYFNHMLASGDKGGAMMTWDLSTGQALSRFRAHPAAITCMDFGDDDHTIITCGTDGYVKVWDPRSTGSGMVLKVLAHQANTAPSHAPPAVGARAGRTGRGSASGRGAASRALVPSGRPAPSPAAGPAGAPVGVMGLLYGRGPGSSVSYIVTGGGSPDDSSLALIDMRRGEIATRWDHHRNGVYSLCVVDNDCVLSGDGLGSLLVHGLNGGDLQNPRQCLRYGLGASEQGAVRAITCVDNKVVTVGEDGKVLVLEYN